MNDQFSMSFVCVSLIVLLIILVTLMPPCSAGLPELPITNHPQNFGYENQNQYVMITIKADGSKYFEQDWLPDMSALSSKEFFRNSDFVLVRADARLSFGEVRKTLAELQRYRTQGIVLMAEKKIVAPNEIFPFEEYLLNRLQYCGC